MIRDNLNNINVFNILSTSTINKSTTLPTDVFDISKGNLSGEITVDPNSNFLKNLGGPNDNSSTVMVTVKKSADYILAIKYNFDARTFRIKVNNIDYTYKTSANSDGSIFYAILPLKAGNNELEFHSDKIAYAPDLGTFTVTEKTSEINDIIENTKFTVGNYNLANGVFSSDEIITGPATNLVSNIGGTEDNSVSLLIEVPRLGDYTLNINYRDANKTFMIRYGGQDIKVVTPELENGIVKVDLTFNYNNNLVIFHGDGKNYAPDLGLISVAFNSTIPNEIYNVALGKLENGAILDNSKNLVTALGGKKDGASTITIKVPEAGDYKFSINYYKENTPYVMDINEKSNTYWTGDEYFAFTNEIVTLKKGDNIIKFHGDTLYDGPDLGMMMVTSIPSEKETSILSTNTPKVVIKELIGDATIDINDFINNISGLSDSAVLANANVAMEGFYNLQVEYTAPNFDRVMKIDINDINTGSLYHLSNTLGNTLTDIKKFITPIFLTAGNNTIKFYSNESNYAPNLRKITIDTVNHNENNYSTNIILSGSAIINGNFIEGLGGSENGALSFKITVPYSGIYDFGIFYVAKVDSKIIKIDVNGLNTGEIYNFNKTKSMDINNEKVKVIKLNLYSGENTIKIYGI
ncbi:hypothetical protein [Clostridium tarantellae]|uniref:CBM6 domain-containing protein n=1 Tax=Clostridium tarantellae TaxID=39493 RepID=A0A6I1MS94_9CLOT|nr:hypothetical protein [Clostridium tarantellae]MPQ45062.1 hypothetical protein [Clostridium tarantellae]